MIFVWHEQYSRFVPESSMKTWKRPAYSILRKLNIRKAFINEALVYKNFSPNKNLFFLQLATELFEMMHMDKKN